MPQKSEEENSVIEFRTNCQWTTIELITFLETVGSLYDTFLSIEYANHQYKDTMINYYRTQQEYLEYISKYSEETKCAYRRWLEERRRFSPYHAPLPFLAPQLSSISVLDILKDINSIAPQNERLKVNKLYMGSLGGISLKGLGKPIKQIRELIKDLCYRNKQERLAGKLEIIKTHLVLTKKFDMTLIEINKVAIEINKSMDHIDNLEQNGNLLEVGENLDYIPELDDAKLSNKNKDKLPKKEDTEPTYSVRYTQ